MEKELLLELLEYLIRIIVIVAGTIGTAYIKKKIDVTQLDKITYWVEVAVRSAEQIFRETGMGENKKQYVINFLKSKGLNINVNELDNLIEAVVYEMKRVA